MGDSTSTMHRRGAGEQVLYFIHEAVRDVPLHDEGGLAMLESGTGSAKADDTTAPRLPNSFDVKWGNLCKTAAGWPRAPSDTWPSPSDTVIPSTL